MDKTENDSSVVHYEVANIKHYITDVHYDLALVNFVLQFCENQSDLLTVCEKLYELLNSATGRAVGFVPNGCIDAVMTDEMAVKYGKRIWLSFEHKSHELPA